VTHNETHNSEQSAYFDGLAQTRGQNASHNADKFAVIEALLPDVNTHRHVLECGGGAGFYTGRFLSRGHDVTCVDLSEDALAVNRAAASRQGRAAQLRTQCSDFVQFASDAAQAEDRYDLVVFIKVLHHFESFGAIEAALDAALKVLAPGGQIFIFEPNGKNPLWEVLYRAQKVNAHQTKWDFEKNLQLITQTNFDAYLRARPVRGRFGFHYLVPAQVLNIGVPLAGLILKRLNRRLEVSPLAPWAANISLVIRQ